jgi:tetratricopeptide (TPR) repeat protein
MSAGDSEKQLPSELGNEQTPVEGGQQRRRRRSSHRGSRSQRSHENEQMLELDDEAESAAEDQAAAPQEPSTPRWATILAAGFPVLLCFLGAGFETWIWGLTAGCIGLLLILYPPQGKLPLSVLILLLGISTLCVVSVVPMPWPSWPDWRVPLKPDFGIEVGTAWSPQPMVTLELWLQQVVMMLWLLWWVGRKITTTERRYSMVTVAAGLALLAVVTLLFYLMGVEPALWTQLRNDFGPFDNRNHFSALMALSCVLSLSAGYELQRRQHPMARWCMVGLIPAFICILLNVSRAGLALFFIGMVAWFITTSFKRGRVKRLAVGGTLVLVAVTVVTLAGRHILERMRSGEDGTVSVSGLFQGRTEVFLEALRFASDHPGLGVGLGNFENVFSMFHRIDGDYLGFSHPESDLLWFLCEAGWPATLCLIMLLGVLVRWTGPWFRRIKDEGRGERRFRISAAICCGLAIIHGCVDTPNHTLPFLTLLLMLLGLSLRQRKMELAAGLSSPTLFRVLGVGCLLLSGVWWATAAGKSTFMGESSHFEQMALARQALKEKRPSDALVHVDSAIQSAPMTWTGYFLRASTLLEMNRPASQALTDFGRVRYLEQHVSSVPLDEGRLWLAYDPKYAIPAWREALRRSTGDQLARYNEICGVLKDYPELASAVRGLAYNAALKNYFITLVGNAFPDEARNAIQDVLSMNPSLSDLKDWERYQFLIYWSRLGDREALMQQLDKNSSLMNSGWFLRAEEYGRKGQFEQAYRLADRYAELSALTSPGRDVAELQRSFTFNPSDIATGTDLYSVQRAKGMVEESLQTLKKLELLEKPPRFIQREYGRIYASRADYVKAWEHMRKFIGQTVGY